MSFQWVLWKLLQRSMSHELTAYFLVFWPMKWSYFQKYASQITLNHTTIYHLALPLFEVFFSLLSLDVNFSVNQSLLIFLLCVRQTWKTQLILAFFYLRGDLPLNGKESNTCMHGLAVYVKEGLHFALDFSLKNSKDSCFWLVLHYFISYFFSLMDYCLCLCTQFLLLFQT